MFRSPIPLCSIKYCMKLWLKYSLINTALGTGVGVYIWNSSIDSDKLRILISMIISAFIVSAIFWKLIVRNKEEITTSNVLAVGFLSGIVSHYFTFVIWGIWRLLCYSITGDCTSSLGDPPPGFFELLLISLPASFITLIIYGWITIPLAMGGGLLLRYFEKKT